MLVPGGRDGGFLGLKFGKVVSETHAALSGSINDYQRIVDAARAG